MSWEMNSLHPFYPNLTPNMPYEKKTIFPFCCFLEEGVPRGPKIILKENQWDRHFFELGYIDFLWLKAMGIGLEYSTCEKRVSIPSPIFFDIQYTLKRCQQSIKFFTSIIKFRLNALFVMLPEWMIYTAVFDKTLTCE